MENQASSDRRQPHRCSALATLPEIWRPLRVRRRFQALFFYIFYFRFLQKYIFDLEIYRSIPGRPAAGRPGPGRPATGRQGLERKKKKKKKLQTGPWGRSPGSGAADPLTPLITHNNN